VQVTNWAFNTGLLLHLSKEARPIKENPVLWAHDNDTKLESVRAASAMSSSLFGIALKNHLRLSPLVTEVRAKKLSSLVCRV
jgi:hypothetical protein